MSSYCPPQDPTKLFAVRLPGRTHRRLRTVGAALGRGNASLMELAAELLEQHYLAMAEHPESGEGPDGAVPRGPEATA